MKHLVCLVIFSSFIFSSCDPELNYFYSVENLTENEIDVTSQMDLIDDPTLNTITIPPNSTIEIGSYHFIGTTRTIDTDPIYLERIDIINDDGADYNKDPFDNALWVKTKDGRHDGYFLLQVVEEDF